MPCEVTINKDAHRKQLRGALTGRCDGVGNDWGAEHLKSSRIITISDAVCADLDAEFTSVYTQLDETGILPQDLAQARADFIDREQVEIGPRYVVRPQDVMDQTMTVAEFRQALDDQTPPAAAAATGRQR